MIMNEWFHGRASTKQHLTRVKSWQVADGSEELTVVDRHFSQPLQRLHPLCVSIGLQSCFLQSKRHLLQLGPGLPELLQTPAYPLQVRLDHGLEGKQQEHAAAQRLLFDSHQTNSNKTWWTEVTPYQVIHARQCVFWCVPVMSPWVWCVWRRSSDSLSSCTGSGAPDAQVDRKHPTPTSGQHRGPNTRPSPPLAIPQPLALCLTEK